MSRPPRFAGRAPPRGFSLIEVLVAAAVLSVGLLALASLQVSIVRTSSDAKAYSVALSLAKDMDAMVDYTAASTCTTAPVLPASPGWVTTCAGTATASPCSWPCSRCSWCGPPWPC